MPTMMSVSSCPEAERLAQCTRLGDNTTAFPGTYVPSDILTARRERLVVPASVLTQLAQEASQAAAARAERTQAATESDRRLDAVTEDEPASGNWHPVFDPAVVDELVMSSDLGDSDRRRQYRAWSTQMLQYDGRREIVGIDRSLDALSERFPNFSAVVKVIEALVALQERGQTQAEALILFGPAGIGKSHFVEQLAETFGVAHATVSLGSAQGGFAVVGTSKHWSNAAPGRVWQLLAQGRHANAVLLLDEIDKMRGDDRYQTSGALLELLDARQAAHFRDQAIEIEMDASLLWKVATANSLDTLPKPLLSRLHVIEIAPPTDEQLRCIYAAQWSDLTRGITNSPRLSSGLIRQLVAERMSPRTAQRTLRLTLGRALFERRKVVTELFRGHNAGDVRRGIGFI